MQLVSSQFSIVEKKGDIPQLIKHIADAVRRRRLYDKSPMVSVVSPWIEEACLLPCAIKMICDTITEYDSQENTEDRLRKSDELLVIQALHDCSKLDEHIGPVLVNVPDILVADIKNGTDDWGVIQQHLMENSSARFIVLASGKEIGVLMEIHNRFLPILPSKIYRVFHWPDPFQRSASVKRDYFIHFVSEKSPAIAEVIQMDPEACALLRRSFKQLSLDDTWIECLRAHAHRYVEHVELFNDEHPTKVLESYMKELCRKNLSKKTNAA
mgnify:CR=1 FL=1